MCWEVARGLFAQLFEDLASVIKPTEKVCCPPELALEVLTACIAMLPYPGVRLGGRITLTQAALAFGLEIKIPDVFGLDLQSLFDFTEGFLKAAAPPEHVRQH